MVFQMVDNYKVEAEGMFKAWRDAEGKLMNLPSVEGGLR